MRGLALSEIGDQRVARNMKTFREAVCERLDISPEAFEEEVLWRCFFPHTVVLGKILWLLKAAHFDEDLEMIREVAGCVSVSQVCAELNDFRYHHPLRGLPRRFLRVRVSGQRLVELAALVLR